MKLIDLSFLLVIVTTICLLQDAWGAKILFYFGGGSYSHKNSAWPLILKLAERNHQVTIISGVSKTPSQHPLVKDVVSKSLESLMEANFGVDRFQERYEGKEGTNLMTTFHPNCVRVCKDFLESLKTDQETASHIYNTSYDLVMVNAIFGDCGFVIAYQLRINKTIIYDSSMPLTWFSELFGYSQDSHWIPSVMLTHDRSPLNFLDRIENLMYNSYWIWDRFTNFHPQMEKLTQDQLNLTDPPSFAYLERNSSIVLVNSYPATDFAYSLPPNFIQIGGMQLVEDEKPIPQVYKKFMDDAGPEGVVLISFGSTVNLEAVSEYFQDIFFDLIAKYPQVRFLMRWKGQMPDKYSGRLNNLLLSPWLPQRELLRHPKLKAFITHGGMNSVQEATYFGVPIIVIPLFADQDYNAYRVHSQKVGIKLELRDISPQILQDSLQLLLRDPVYRVNMERSSKIFRDRPLNAVDTAVFWTEFVLRHDDLSNLKPQIDHLSWFQTRLLDIYLCILILLSIPLSLFLLLVYKFLQFLRKPRKLKVN